MDREELAAWLRLSLTHGIGSDAGRRLLAAFGLPTSVFGQTQAALQQVVGPAQSAALIAQPPNLQAHINTTLAWLAEAPAGTRRVVTLGDADYPQALLHTADPPLLLYIMGRTLANWPAAIAMVGSRNPTPQGVTNAQQFAKAFVQAGLTVVSGMALGVDGAAHEGALEAADDQGLATIAVVGTGLDRVYPKQHFDLAHRIAQRGVIISEYPLGTPPLQHNFPRRNRLISALSLGTLVVEAALKSGSLITARFAGEQGKDVFAIPGSIHSTQSRGCHALIKQGAKLVESAQDVLEELHVVPRPVANDQISTSPDDAQAPGLLGAMGFDPVSLDALIARTGISAANLQAQLLELELCGDIARLPGGLFQRQGHA